MSETVHYIGKLKPTGKTVSEYAGDVEIPEGDTLDEYFEGEYYNGGCGFNEALKEAINNNH